VRLRRREAQRHRGAIERKLAVAVAIAVADLPLLPSTAALPCARRGGQPPSDTFDFMRDGQSVPPKFSLGSISMPPLKQNCSCWESHRAWRPIVS
jgi:hypothetical protein